jgi:hypothetical protein
VGNRESSLITDLGKQALPPILADDRGRHKALPATAVVGAEVRAIAYNE